MTGVLSNRLALASAMIGGKEAQAVFLAALRLGATMALARVSEVGGSYPTGSDVKAVMTELDGDTERTKSQPSETLAPAAEDESTRFNV